SLMRHFDGDSTAELVVVRQVNAPESPFAEKALDSITADFPGAGGRNRRAGRKNHGFRLDGVGLVGVFRIGSVGIRHRQVTRGHNWARFAVTIYCSDPLATWLFVPGDGNRYDHNDF